MTSQRFAAGRPQGGRPYDSRSPADEAVPQGMPCPYGRVRVMTAGHDSSQCTEPCGSNPPRQRRWSRGFSRKVLRIRTSRVGVPSRAATGGRTYEAASGGWRTSRPRIRHEYTNDVSAVSHWAVMRVRTCEVAPRGGLPGRSPRIASTRLPAAWRTWATTPMRWHCVRAGCGCACTRQDNCPDTGAVVEWRGFATEAIRAVKTVTRNPCDCGHIMKR